MSRLDLALLGTFSVRRDDEPITGFALDSARSLLAYLVLNPVIHRRESIAALFWEDRSTESALKQLRLTLNKLRDALVEPDEFVRTETRTLQFNPEADYVLDVAQFDALLGSVNEHSHRRLRGCRACLDKLKQAAQLYRGELLAGITLDSQPFEEWLRGERERYHQQALETLYELAEASAERGEWREVENYARRQLKLEPWREEAHYQLMLAFAARNQQSALRTQYRECVKVLQVELGTTPSAKTRELFEKIESGEWRLETAISTLQAPISTALIGRESEAAKLVSRVTDASARLVSIVGLGGIGKTTLAHAVAEQVRYSFEEGVLFVTLADAAAEPTTENLLNALAHTLSIRRDARSAETQVLDVLAQRDVLLVLDNLEPWLAQEGEATRAFLSKALVRAPRVVFLVTSREVVGLVAEHVLRLDGLAVPPPEADARLIRQYPSVEMFIERAERIAPQMDWDAATLNDVGRLCGLVNGTPLALELAAAWMNRATLFEIISNLETNLDTLATHYADIPERHRSMRAVFAQSWDYLPPQAQTLLTKVTLFRGGFTRAAVQYVTQDQHADAYLDLLQARSLVARDQQGRYSFHELVRQFAAAQAGEQPDPALRSRHSEFYLQLIAPYASITTYATTEIQKQLLRADLENLRLAWQTALDHAAWSEVGGALESIVTFWKQLSLFGEIVQMTGEALARAQRARAPEHFLARIESKHGMCLTWIASYTDALMHGRSAAEWANQSDDARLIAESEYVQGYVYSYTVDYAAARFHFDRAIAAAKRAGDVRQEAEILRIMTQILYRTSEWKQEWMIGLRSLELYRQVDDRHGEASLLINLGHAQREQGNWARAEEMLIQAEKLCAEIGDVSLLAAAESSHACVLTEIGEYDRAKTLFVNSMRQKRQLGDRRSLASILANYGTHLSWGGEYDEARTYLEQAIVLSREIGWRNNETWAQIRLAFVYLGMNQAADAVALAQEVLAVTEQYHFDDDRAEAYSMLGDALLAAGQTGGVEDAFLNSLEVQAQLNDDLFTVEALSGLASLYLQKGDSLRALERVEQILPLLAQYHALHAFEPLRIYLSCYQVLAANHDPRASEILQEGYTMLQQRAATMQDPDVRRNYLENIPVNRELAHTYESSIVALPAPSFDKLLV